MKKLFFIYPIMVAVVLTAIIAGCSKDDEYKPDYNPLIDDPKEEPVDNPQPPASSGRNEQYRP